MDKLKKYIDENREAFDKLEPQDTLWEKINSDLSDKKAVAFTPKRWLNWRAAASIVVLLTMGYMVGKYYRPVADNNEIISISPKNGSEVKFSTPLLLMKEKEIRRIL